MQIGILGRGRAGRSLARALRGAGYRVTLVDRAGIGRLSGMEVVFLAVPDDQISRAAARLPQTLRLVAHLSGAHALSALGAVAGAMSASFHPLRAIPNGWTPLRGALVTLDGPPAARRQLARIARDLGMRPISERPADRGRYHLGAALAANSIPPLLELAVAQMVRSGLRPRSARAAVGTLAESALAAWMASDGPSSLTGPIARGDSEVVRRHLALLRAGSAERGVYLAVARAALALARRRKPPPTEAERLAKVARILREA